MLSYKIMKMLKKHIKLIAFCLVLILYFYPQFITRPLYQKLYGQPTNQQLTISDKDFFEDITHRDDIVYDLQYKNQGAFLTPVVKYSVTGRLGILEHYDGWFENFYHKHDKRRIHYNHLAPTDLSIIIGQTAYDPTFSQCSFSHEYRVLWHHCPTRKREDVNNYHIIPANENIKKALKTLIKGDILYIEGLLVDVKSVTFPDFKLTTGRRKNQTHKDQFVGGKYTGMCFVLYTTKIITGNHIYQ